MTTRQLMTCDFCQKEVEDPANNKYFIVNEQLPAGASTTPAQIHPGCLVGYANAQVPQENKENTPAPVEEAAPAVS